MKIPVFLPVTREFGFRDEFAQDCLLQRRVSSELALLYYVYSRRTCKGAGDTPATTRRVRQDCGPRCEERADRAASGAI